MRKGWLDTTCVLFLLVMILAFFVHSEQQRVELQATKGQLQTSKAYSEELIHTINDSNTETDKIQAQVRELTKELDGVKAQLQEKDAELEKQKTTLASRSGGTFLTGGGQALTGFETTWYNVTGTTASGAQTQDGVTVAADPNILPLGTWVELVFPDGTTMKRCVQDTGGAVKGRILDIYSSAPTSELLKRGRVHDVTVRILGR